MKVGKIFIFMMLVYFWACDSGEERLKDTYQAQKIDVDINPSHDDLGSLPKFDKTAKKKMYEVQEKREDLENEPPLSEENENLTVEDPSVGERDSEEVEIDSEEEQSMVGSENLTVANNMQSRATNEEHEALLFSADRVIFEAALPSKLKSESNSLGLAEGLSTPENTKVFVYFLDDNRITISFSGDPKVDSRSFSDDAAIDYCSFIKLEEKKRLSKSFGDVPCKSRKGGNSIFLWKDGGYENGVPVFAELDATSTFRLSINRGIKVDNKDFEPLSWTFMLENILSLNTSPLEFSLFVTKLDIIPRISRIKVEGSGFLEQLMDISMGVYLKNKGNVPIKSNLFIKCWALKGEARELSHETVKEYVYPYPSNVFNMGGSTGHAVYGAGQEMSQVGMTIPRDDIDMQNQTLKGLYLYRCAIQPLLSPHTTYKTKEEMFQAFPQLGRNDDPILLEFSLEYGK